MPPSLVLPPPLDVPPPARPAFADVYRGELAYVWHTLRRLGGRPAELEDLAHDVFIVVHRRLSDYDPERPLRPWLFGICFRVVSERRRRRVPEAVGDPETRFGVALADQGPDPEAACAAGQARAVVVAALGRLSLEQRAVIVLHDIDGVPVPEIAVTLSVPLNTVYSRLRLARANFATAVAACTGDGEEIL